MQTRKKPSATAVRGFTLLELVCVFAVISVIATLSVSVYVQMLGQARLASANLVASRFEQVASQLHLAWIVSSNSRYIELGNYTVEMSDKGWPVGIKGQSDINACEQLSMSFLKKPDQSFNPNPSLNWGLSDQVGDVQIISQPPNNDACEFSIVINNSQDYVFSYQLLSGKVQFKE